MEGSCCEFIDSPCHLIQCPLLLISSTHVEEMLLFLLFLFIVNESKWY